MTLPALSDNKTNFLKSVSKYPELEDRVVRISSKDLDALIPHYSSKGIKIIKNGQIKVDAIKKKQSEILRTINKFEDNSTKYAMYVKQHLFKKNSGSYDDFFISNLRVSNFCEYYTEIINAVKKFLIADGMIKPNLSEKDLIALNIICSKLTCAPLLDEYIQKYIIHLNNQRLDVNLNQNEINEEIEEIRKNLKENECVGYIFTGGKSVSAAHFEVLLLTKEIIVKPIIWTQAAYSLSSNDLGDIPLYTTDLRYFFPFDVQRVEKPEPQKSESFCGALGISTLKKMLKKDALEFNTLTLCACFYNDNHEKKFFFLPSPATILYSQGSEYSILLKKIMEEKDTEEYFFKKMGGIFPILTLQGSLINSIKIAKLKHDTAMLKHNEETSARLDEMRPAWIKKYEEIQRKREAMFHSQTKYFHYLKYTHSRLKKRIGHLSNPQENTETISSPNIFRKAWSAFKWFCSVVVKIASWPVEVVVALGLVYLRNYYGSTSGKTVPTSGSPQTAQSAPSAANPNIFRSEEKNPNITIYNHETYARVVQEAKRKNDGLVKLDKPVLREVNCEDIASSSPSDANDEHIISSNSMTSSTPSVPQSVDISKITPRTTSALINASATSVNTPSTSDGTGVSSDSGQFSAPPSTSSSLFFASKEENPGDSQFTTETISVLRPH